MGYGTKADIFSAGIILAIILTGVSPFHGKTYQEVLLKNKEGNVPITGSHWSYVSEEAKNLVSNMVAKNPQDRCSASEALTHPWFTLSHTKLIVLSNAQENMKKYKNENRFNVSRIKPEFSMVTCTPLLNSRFSGKDSPLIVPKVIHKKEGDNKLPELLQRRKDPEEKKDNKSKLIFRDINDKFKKDTPVVKENKGHDLSDSGDFDEKDMDEKPKAIKETIKTNNHSFIPRDFEERKLPPTPGFSAKKSMSYLKYLATPLQNRRGLKNSPNGHYLQSIARIRNKEEGKNQEENNKERNLINPFTVENPCEDKPLDEIKIETDVGKKKRGNTPKFAARNLKEAEKFN